MIERYADDGLHLPRELAERVKQYTTMLKEELTKSAPAPGELKQATW